MIVIDASATVDLLLGTERAGAVADVVRTVRERIAAVLGVPAATYRGQCQRRIRCAESAVTVGAMWR